MSLATKSIGPKGGGTYVAKALARWSNVPDWVMQLAMHADLLAKSGSSLADLADRVGCHRTAITSAIGKTYAGRYEHLEALVRGSLMSATVDCPVLNKLSRAECAKNQKLPFSGCSPARAQLFRACRGGCPHAFGGNNAS